MTSKDRIDLTRKLIIGIFDLPDLNPVHLEYLKSLLNRIDNEVSPFSETIPDEASILLFEEVLKASSVILFSKGKKVPSCRITKKATSKFFDGEQITFKGFENMKSSRYGLSLMNMNLNQFLKVVNGK